MWLLGVEIEVYAAILWSSRMQLRRRTWLLRVKLEETKGLTVDWRRVLRVEIGLYCGIGC